MQIINTIEIICSKCGKPVPTELPIGRGHNPDKWIFRVLPCGNCANIKDGFDPDYAVPPGEILKESMDSLGISKKEFSKLTGLTVQSLNRIIKGEQPITYDMANMFELVTNVPAKLWNNLEANYIEQCQFASRTNEI